MADLEAQQSKQSAEQGSATGAEIHHHVTRILHDDEYIHFGNERYLKSDLVGAFGGTLNPGLAPPPKNDLANPAPLGLSALALSLFVWSLINMETRGVKIPNIVVGLGFFYGGAAEFIAAMFEIGVGNTFGGVALASFAGFWCSWAAIHTRLFGIVAAFGSDTTELRYALGVFFVGWFIFTFFLSTLTLKSTLAFFILFFLLTLMFLMLAIAEFGDSKGCKKAGGVFGIIAAFAAWYNAYAGIANEQNSYLVPKAIQLPDLQAKRD